MFRRSQRWMGGAIAFAVASSLVIATPEVAGADPGKPWTAQTEKSVPVSNATAQPAPPDAAEEKALKGTPAVTWPAPSITEVSSASTSSADTQQRGAVAQGPIKVKRAAGAAARAAETVSGQLAPGRNLSVIGGSDGREAAAAASRPSHGPAVAPSCR